MSASVPDAARDVDVGVQPGGAVLSVSVLTFRPPSSNRLPTGLGGTTPVAVHAPTTVIMSSGSDRIRTV